MPFDDVVRQQALRLRAVPPVRPPAIVKYQATNSIWNWLAACSTTGLSAYVVFSTLLIYRKGNSLHSLLVSNAQAVVVMSPLSIAEVENHSEYGSVIWDLSAAKKGNTIVASDRRGGPFPIAYEVHGEGPTKLVFVVGLGGWMSGWKRQTKDFGHSLNTNGGQSQKYSVLIFDNRGIGKSGKPFTRYSTSEMAKDIVELVDHVGWTKERQLHVIGSSMGGMISQELSLMIPSRIASLSLVASAPRIFNTVGWIQNLKDRINLVLPKELDIQIEETKRRLFSDEWLAEADQEGHFPTNGDRFTALELTKRRSVEFYSRQGFFLQLIAAGWHHKSATQLKELGDLVGRSRIQVIHGTDDRMVTFQHGEVLAAELGGTDSGLTFVPVEGKSHGLHIEWRKGLRAVLANHIEKTESIEK